MKLRVHLSTLVILSLAAGFLIWANTSPKPPVGGELKFDAQTHRYARSLLVMRGWPFVFEEEWTYTPWEARGLPEECIAFADLSHSKEAHLEWSLLGFNMLLCLLILAALGACIEWFARHGTVAQT